MESPTKKQPLPRKKSYSVSISSASRSRSSSSSSSRSSSRTYSRSSGSSSSGSSYSRSSYSSASDSQSSRERGGRKFDRRSKRYDEKRRHMSRSKEREVKCLVFLNYLSKNVNTGHLKQIFGYYGSVKTVDLVFDELTRKIPSGKAYVMFDKPEDADTAVKFMNGADIDGNKIKAIVVQNADRSPTKRAPYRSYAKDRGSRFYEDGRSGYKNYRDRPRDKYYDERYEREPRYYNRGSRHSSRPY